MPCTRRGTPGARLRSPAPSTMHRWGGPRGPGSRAFLGRGASPRPGWGPLGQEGRGRGHAPSQRRGGMKSERPGGVPASGLPGPRTPPTPRRPPLPRQEGWGRDPLLSVLGAAQRKNVHDPPPPQAPLPPEPSEGVRSAPPAPLSVPGDPRPRPAGWRGESANGGPHRDGGLRGGCVAPGCKALAEEAGGARWLPRNPPGAPAGRAGRPAPPLGSHL